MVRNGFQEGMKRFGAVVRIVAAVALAQLGWTWLERHDGDMRMRRLLAGRGVAAGTVAPDDGALRIESFYAREAEITEGERNLVCYGVRNAKSLRLEPRVEELSPAAVVRCFWIAPRESTTY